jgi:predicted O-linked N-acetylglucosamine transferase (SPINDLY family)
VQFRLFPGVVSSDNSYLPFAADLREALGESERVQIVPFCPYPQYMSLLEEGGLTLDSFHFAGSNTVAENLFLRKPTVVLEGDKWYNRIGPSMLRLVGLDELICTSEDEYVEKACRLIHDDSHREALTAKLRDADLDATIFSTEHASSFPRAIEYLIANHDRLKTTGSRAPIVIA